MSDRVLQDCTEDFIRRMRNWARSMAGTSIGYAQCSIFIGVTGDGYRESPFPILKGEADDTELCLNLVPIRYQQAVRIYWGWEGRSFREMSKRCACNHETFISRVIEGHRQLRAEIARATEKWAQRREANSASVPVPLWAKS